MRQNDLHKHADICLVLMPWAVMSHPSPALGILKACLNTAAISSRTVYANLLFAAEIGFDSACVMSAFATLHMIGDWVFSGVAFPGFGPDNTGHLRKVGQAFECHPLFKTEKLHDADDVVRDLHRIRDLAGSFVDRLAADILAGQPSVVACTSTFVQHVASLALLRRIKELSPGVVTMIGGANCEDIMGVATVREFPWIDIAFSGEADQCFAELCGLLIEKGTGFDSCDLPFGAIDSATARTLLEESAEERVIPRAVTADMDSVPVPDYREYFDQLSKLEFRKRITPGIPAETSRGCWWGCGKGCTFCGLNGTAMKYRSKSPAKAVGMLDSLAETYGITRFEMVDNIVDTRYVNSVFPELSGRSPKYEIFYETKAALKREEMESMASAGIKWLQPGIEALHDDMLKLMNKHTTVLQNVQFLKYARELGIDVLWFIMVGLPGEQDGWHGQTAEWLPLISHLQPPRGLMPVVFQRFSAYHENPAEFGLDLDAYEGYREIFPVDEATLDDLVYFFSDLNRSVPGPRDLPRGLDRLNALINDWKNAYRHKLVPSVLCMTDNAEKLDIFDTRPCAPVRSCTLDGVLRWICLEADPAVDMKALCESGEGSGDITSSEIEKGVAELLDRKLLLEHDCKFLSLPLQGEIPETPKGFPGGYVDIKGEWKIL